MSRSSIGYLIFFIIVIIAFMLAYRYDNNIYERYVGEGIIIERTNDKTECNLNGFIMETSYIQSIERDDMNRIISHYKATCGELVTNLQGMNYWVSVRGDSVKVIQKK